MTASMKYFCGKILEFLFLSFLLQRRQKIDDNRAVLFFSFVLFLWSKEPVKRTINLDLLIGDPITNAVE